MAHPRHKLKSVKSSSQATAALISQLPYTYRCFQTTSDISINTQGKLSHHQSYLGWHISMSYRILQMRHQHEVSSLKPLVVQSQVIYVIEYSLRSDTISVIVDVDITTQCVHLVYTSVLLSGVSSLVKL